MNFSNPLFRATVLGLALTAASSAFANSGTPLDLEAVRTQQTQIRADVEAKRGRYKNMPAATRSELLAKQDAVARTIGTAATSVELTEQQRIEVFNALESIEAIVNKAEDDRMVCRRIKPVGSNRPETVCHTVAQLRAEERNNEQRRNQICGATTGVNCE